jgi:DNA-binding transcriptional LysR family regulator
MLDDLKPLAIFAKVAELGSFRAAARACALSASVVSHHVSELEQRLAVPLLYRSTRRLALTADGEQLLASARAMVDAASRGLDAVTGRAAAPSGRLRITAPAFFAETAFPDDLAAFVAAHPRVELAASFSEAPRDLLRDGLDLALRIGKLADSSLKVKKLADMHRLLVASPRYLSGKPPLKHPRELAGWELVRLSSRPAEVAFAARGKARPFTVAVASKLSVDSAAVMRALAVAGAGLTALPAVMVRDAIARGELVELLPGWPLAIVGVYAIRPGGATASSLAQAFVEFLAPRLAAMFRPVAR